MVTLHQPDTSLVLGHAVSSSARPLKRASSLAACMRSISQLWMVLTAQDSHAEKREEDPLGQLDVRLSEGCITLWN